MHDGGWSGEDPIPVLKYKCLAWLASPHSVIRTEKEQGKAHKHIFKARRKNNNNTAQLKTEQKISQMANKHIKGCSIAHVIREMSTNSTVKCRYIALRMATI